MSEEAIIKHCSPTLAGLKTGTILNSRYPSRLVMTDAVRAWNRRLRGKGIRLIPLRYCDGSALIYMYRPTLLERDINNREARCLLNERGYSAETCEGCIVHLIRRLAERKEFPHEIGLFLGYPPEDVSGFIRNEARDCKTVGCWKVYGDRERAEELFRKYKKCAEVYRRRWSEGTTIERLTVAV